VNEIVNQLTSCADSGARVIVPVDQSNIKAGIGTPTDGLNEGVGIGSMDGEIKGDDGDDRDDGRGRVDLTRKKNGGRRKSGCGKGKTGTENRLDGQDRTERRERERERETVCLFLLNCDRTET